MRFNLLADFYWEAKIEKVLADFSEYEYRQHFSEKNYGEDLLGITVIFMCQPPELQLKQRIKYSKKEKRIYLDILLDIHEFIRISQTERKKIMLERLNQEIPLVVQKFKLKNFNLKQFKDDLKNWSGRLM